MIVSAIVYNQNDKQKNKSYVKPANANKSGNKTTGTVSAYQLLQQQAMAAYRR